MSEPVRIQRKRSKGWKMPPNTVYVGRPSMWGNPYKPDLTHSIDEAVEMFRHDCETERILDYVWERWLTSRDDDYWDMDEWLRPLRGKNLSCWCPIDQPCHADVLLELANGNTRSND